MGPGGAVMGPGQQETTTMSQRPRGGLDGARNGL